MPFTRLAQLFSIFGVLIFLLPLTPNVTFPIPRILIALLGLTIFITSQKLT